jgi:hypothetical protein
MKVLTIGLAALVVICAAAQSGAQEDDGFLVIPTEIYVCSYNDGQGPAELEKVIGVWNQYMDKNQVDTYSAWTLTPFYFGEEQEFDFLWMGAWKNGNAMGAGTDMWLSSGGEVAARFAKVATCNAHINSASVNYKLPPDGQTPDTGVLSYTNCNMHDGVTYEQVSAASREWAQVLTDAGSSVALYHQFPVFGGGGDDEPDFRILEAYANHAELGADYERMGNGRLYMKSGELFDSLMTCDSSRIYNARNRRFVKLR